jgi:hypothetical protein
MTEREKHQKFYVTEMKKTEALGYFEIDLAFCFTETPYRR